VLTAAGRLVLFYRGDNLTHPIGNTGKWREDRLRQHSISRALLTKYSGPAALSAALSFATTGAALAAASCQGPGAPTTTQTECETAILIPGNPLQSFDISWVDADRAEYYLADRANKGIDIIDTEHDTFKRRIGGFVGIVFNETMTAIDNNHSGPDGVVTHGRWLYAGDGDSTLKVFDLNTIPTPAPQILNTGGTTRVDEMALTTDGKLLIVANNAEDPPFATLFKANGDASPPSNVTKIIKITVDPAIIPAGFGLSIEQPAWEPKTQRFYTSIPIIANNPTGCNYGQIVTTPPTPITCDGGLLVTDPLHPAAVEGAFDPATNTGVVPLHACGPNRATVGPHQNLLLGCTPGNNPSNTTTLVINAETKNYANIGGITGSDEVWFNAGDKRYYTGYQTGRLEARQRGRARRDRRNKCPDRNHTAILRLAFGGSRLQAEPYLRSASVQQYCASPWRPQP